MVRVGSTLALHDQRSRTPRLPHTHKAGDAMRLTLSLLGHTLDLSLEPTAPARHGRTTVSADLAAASAPSGRLTAVTNPPKHIDPDTLVTPLFNVTGPLPAGTGLYDANGDLIAVLGESIPAEDPEFQFTVPLLPPSAG